MLNQALLGSADARKLDEFAPSLQKVFPRPTPPAMFHRKDEETPIRGPVSLFDAVTAAGRKGIALQRYKGLGEMNPGSSGKPRSTPTPARCSRSTSRRSTRPTRSSTS